MTEIRLLLLALTIGAAAESCENKEHTRCYQNGAVVTDDERCSVVGADILRNGGNAVDAAIATAICQGVNNNYHSGIGGGAFMVIYDPNKVDKAVYYDCREVAPLAAHRDMMDSDPEKSRFGPLAIAVPGELKCWSEVHKRHGKLRWEYLFRDSIKMARDGFEIFEYMANAMQKHQDYLQIESYGWEVYLKEDGTVKEAGDIIVDEKLAKTLERIAEDPEEFYNGQLADDIFHDLEDVGSIISMEDLNTYAVNITAPLQSQFDGKDIYFSRAVSSGPILQLMLNMLSKLDLTPENHMTDWTFHQIIETMKHGYALRSGLADPNMYVEEMLEMEQRCSDPEFIDSIINNITEKTHPIEYYNPVYSDLPEDHGTLHISTVDKNRQIVSVTTTINQYFGSKIKGKRTGIVFNNEMDDFSNPDFGNGFDFPPSKINFIEPKKRMVSSMVPTIAVDSLTGNPVMSLGGAGGSRITTGILQVILNKLKFGMTNDEAVQFNRIHHQLSPDFLQSQVGDAKWEQLIEDLEHLRGHKPKESRLSNTTPIVQSIYILPDGTIEASCDYRHNGIPDGY